MDENAVIQKLVVLEDEVRSIREDMATKKDISDLIHGQDQMITILQRIDQERTFTTERVKRLEKDVEEIKLQLHVA